MDREEKQIGQVCVVFLEVEVNRAWKRNKEVTRKRNKEVKPVVVVWSTSKGVRDTESERKRRRRPREGSWNGGKKKICLCFCLLQRVTGLRVGYVCVWRAQAAVARCLASLGVAFSEEVVEPVTGYRVDMLLHDGVGDERGRCVVEVDTAAATAAAAAVGSLFLLRLSSNVEGAPVPARRTVLTYCSSWHCMHNHSRTRS